jgi:bis(5'-nucleosyl)-tetraphosphatase (symmetrical)
MPTYSIGDVQGCFSALTALLNKIQFDPAKDNLWFTGDLINRGPQSLETLRFVKSLDKQAITVLGNHDLHLLAVANRIRGDKKQDTLTDILSAPDCQALCDWLRQQPLFHYDKATGYALVHAGLPPQWDLAKASACAAEVETVLRSERYIEFLANMYGDTPASWDDQLSGWERLRLITNYLTRMRFCSLDGALDLAKKGKAENAPEGFLPWFKIPHRQHKKIKIIFGHWAALNGEADEPNIFALDTGCVWGNCLTALRLEDGERFKVSCSEQR